MLKMALLDCVISENCCSVDSGRGICPFFRPHPGGFDSSRVPAPREFTIQGKKQTLMPRAWGGQPRKGAGRYWN